MISKVLEAVETALNTEFGDAYMIYTEETGQKPEGPWFYIQCPEHGCEQLRGRKYVSRNRISVRYVPESADTRNRECYGILERLEECLEYLCMDSPVRGTGMNGRIADGVLHFSVDYDIFFYRTGEAVPLMEHVSSEVDVKG